MPPPSADDDAAERDWRHSRAAWISVGLLVLVIIGASLATSGIFNQGPTGQKAPTPAAFRKEVAGDAGRRSRPRPKPPAPTAPPTPVPTSR